MRVLVQRSKKSSVSVNNKTVGSIDSGLVLLVGFTDGDTIDDIKKLSKKIVNLRIFDDENNIMNKSLLDVGGDILSISQFTLYGDATNGNRPSYIKAMKNMLSSVFLLSIRKFKKLKESMFIRLYSVNSERCNFRINDFKLFDFILILLHVTLLVVVILKGVII